jgi:23S rRNA pseudouridine1911/1915/1917 synthase
VSAARPPIAKCALTVLGEYRGLLFIDKPAGLQTEPDAQHADTLVTRLSEQLGLPRAALHPLSRLDTGVSGVVTFGLTTDARRLVADWRTRGLFRRRYLALATGLPPAEREGSWRDRIGRAAGNLRSVTGRNPELSHTDYACVSSSAAFERRTPAQVHLLLLAPLTGRTHQLRVHCAAHGLPLLGDRAYGGVTRLISETGLVQSIDRIMLHAAWVELPLADPLRIGSPLPRDLLDLWFDFAGDRGALSAAERTSIAELAPRFG